MNNYSNHNDIWDWQGQDYSLEGNTSVEMSKSLLNGVDQNVDHIPYMFSGETTPVKACGDLAYHVANNEVMGKEQYRSLPLKQTAPVLQFESEVLEAPLCDDEAFLRSKETPDSLEDAISEMSKWVAGFTEGIPSSSNEYLDPSSEGWIADCFNDAEMHFCTEDFNSTSGTSDVQIDVTERCNTHPEYDANAIKKHPVNTQQNVAFKGRKSYMRTPPKMTSSVVYPFAFIKPCGVHGDVTLKDINQRIHNPPKSKPKEEPLLLIRHQHFPENLLLEKLKSTLKVEKAALLL